MGGSPTMEVEQPNGSFQEGDVSWQQGGILGMKLKMPAFPHCRRRILLFGTTETKGNSADISDIFFFVRVLRWVKLGLIVADMNLLP